jgi:RHS repeat-associated protein
MYVGANRGKDLTTGMDSYVQTEQGGTVVQNLRGDVVRVNKPSDAGQNNWAIRGQDFGPFGDRLWLWNAGPGPTPATDYGFTGREEDGSGLVFMRNRYYHPQLGRFISQDPIGFAGGLNLYAYCSNDPINFTDPLGLYQTGSYLGDVGQIFAGYGDALNPVNAVNGMIGLGDVAYRCGLGAAASMAGKGLMDMFMGLGSDDPRAFGNSLMGTMMTLAPSLKKVPTPKYFPKLPKLPSKAAGALALASGSGLPSAPMKMVRLLAKGEKVADIIDEAKGLQFETGLEHAVVRLSNGQRALVSGGPGGITFAKGSITRIIGHTHPYEALPTGPSAGDLNALKSLGQTRSYLFERGSNSMFRPNGNIFNF